MNIDLTKMRKCWWEDEDGNIIEQADNEVVSKNNPKAKFMYSVWPCQITQTMEIYDFHPNNDIQRLLAKVPYFKNLFIKKYGKTFRQAYTFNTTYSSPWAQKTIVAMVNSGDYTLEQAIWVFTTACERCMNVLINKYVPELGDGYEEGSEDWEKCGTSCIFCKE